MKTIAITISTENGGIGWNERLPWINLSIANDNFKSHAKNNVVLVGRNAYDSHTHLRGDVTYVYTTRTDLQESDTVKRVSGDPETIINQIKTNNPDKNIIIGGGVTVYEAFYNFIDEWQVTIIEDFVPYNKDINLTNVQYIWNKRVLLNSGIDNNLSFRTYNYSKKNA